VKNLYIGFYTEGIPFDGTTIFNKSLGGSETAMYYMAYHFAKMGCTVTVFCKCTKEGVYEGVRYVDVANYQSVVGIMSFDVFIVSRMYQAFRMPIRSKLNILWNHDTPVNVQGLAEHSWNIDWMFFVSEYHKKLYEEALPVFKEHMIASRNGIDSILINNSTIGVKKQPLQFIYGSRPERGLLRLLLDVWPAIIKKYPTAILNLCGYSLDSTMIQIPEQIKELYLKIDELIQKTPNIIQHGSLKKSDYYKLLAKCTAMLYPSDFPEVYCINAHESIACGTPFVGSDDFSLRTPTQWGGGILVKRDENYVVNFIEAVDRSINYDPKEMIKARDDSRRFGDWSTIAKEWDEFFDKVFAERWNKDQDGIIRNLITYSDLEMATALDPSHPLVIEHTERLHRTVAQDYSDDTVDHYPVERMSKAAYLLLHTSKEEPQTPEILDVGCGVGAFGVGFLSQCPKASYTGIDYSDGVLNMAINKFSKTTYDTKFIKADALEEISKPEYKGAFDMVFAGEFIEHFLGPEKIVTLLESCVKDGGSFCFTVPQGAWEYLSWHKEIRNYHCQHYEYSDLVDMFGHKPDFQLTWIPSMLHARGERCGNFIVCYTKDIDHPIKSRNLEAKKRTRPYQGISLCMITKDEEDNIGRCLKSMVECVDELILVDSKSKDTTLEIVNRVWYKPKTIINIDWPDDFSVARNISVGPAKEKWILWMDADEVLVNPYAMHKYLDTNMYEGYVIRQNHLILDMKDIKPDVPVRLYRNNEKYKFYGKIHEQVQSDWDVYPKPTLILPDVDVVHYGYLSERVRREKCANRNLAMLLQDRKENPQREMGLILLQRDYLNLTNWYLESNNGLSQKNIDYLRMVVKIHYDKFMNEKHQYHKYSDTFTQSALKMLGQRGITTSENSGDAIPFEAALGLSVSFAGVEKDPPKTTRWFPNGKEFEEYMQDKAKKANEALNKVLREVRHAN
jgi:glycosyltransferase involved in cell wall biosynthesis/2-polyprenyl-3-methyl-5-hydroxy-6-metoxy-1,4-benzoquinol methylase